MSAFSRVLAALVLVGVLADASACLLAFAPAHEDGGPTAMSALCPCGCRTHTGAPGGVGLAQPAALPADTLVPPGPRAAPAPAVLPRIARPPAREIDHVPIALA